MKTVKGKVLSTAPASISRPAHVLNNFISSPNGESQAISVYLQRASNAINERHQLHKELKSSSSRSHSKNHTKATVGVDNPNFSLEVGESPPEAKGQVPNLVADEIEQKRKKNKSRKKRKSVEVEETEKLGADDKKSRKKMKKSGDF